jgi:hypothetical protein
MKKTQKGKEKREEREKERRDERREEMKGKKRKTIKPQYPFKCTKMVARVKQIIPFADHTEFKEGCPILAIILTSCSYLLFFAILILGIMATTLGVFNKNYLIKVINLNNHYIPIPSLQFTPLTHSTPNIPPRSKCPAVEIHLGV